MQEIINQINEICENLKAELLKAEGNASAAKRARKLTTELAAACKTFRAESVDFHKKK